MTHRYKKPGAHVILHPLNGKQSKQAQQSLGAQVLNQVQSGLNLVQKNIRAHYVLWGGIGLGCGVAIYLFGTDHGRQATGRVRDALGSSAEKTRDTMTDTFGKLKQMTSNIVNSAIARDRDREVSDVPKLRRVG